MATKITTRVLADDAVTDAKIADVTLTTATQAASDNTTKIATTAYVTTAIANLADSAPSTLNTLNELAAALGDDASFSTTVTNSIATKLPLAGGTMTGTLNVTQASTADTIKLTRGTTSHNNMIKFVTGSSDKWIVGQRNDSTDHFRFYSYGTSSDVLSILTDGKVGIGTTSPGEKLEVDGIIQIKRTGDHPAIRFMEDGNTRAYMGSGDWAINGGAVDDFGISGSGTGDLLFGTTAGVEKMRITNGGKVGIGDTSPFTKLHVEDTGWSSGAPYGAVASITGNNVNDNNWGHLIVTDSSTANGNGGSIRFGTGTADASNLNPIAGIQGVSEGTAYGGLALYTRPSGGSATERLLINSAGNVGIANSNPSRALLHVGGNGIAVNTTRDVSKTAILRTSGTGNYSTSGNGSASHALTLMRGSNAVDGDQVGLSFVLDDGGWSATSEIMAEVEQASSANTRLNFKTWNASGAMRTTSYITSEGQVVKPYQSAFVAVRDSAQSIAVNQNVIFNNAYKNIGADYNTTNGSYTAPISGFYFFSYTILIVTTATFHIDHYLRTSNHSFIGGMPGRIEYQAAGSGTWGDGYIGFGHAQTVYMDAGDTAHVDFSELGGATRTIYGNSGNNWTKFTGYFLG